MTAGMDVTVTDAAGAKRLLLLLAKAVERADDPAAKLLELVAGRDDSAELRSALLEVGARTAVGPRVVSVKVEQVRRCPSCGQHAPVVA